MTNPLEELAHKKQTQEGEDNFEQGFAFACEGKQYVANTEKVITQEGNKYRLEIKEQEASPSSTPLWASIGMNKDELRELVGFMRTATSENGSIDEVIKAAMNYTIDTHATASQK